MLTRDQIDAGEILLTDGKLSASQVSDLVSIFRAYLGDLADDYPLEATFTAQDDKSDQTERAAKLAACLTLFQENQFTPTSGFAATSGNKTGFNYSVDEEVYKCFEYAFGLFWTVPTKLKMPFRHLVSSQGKMHKNQPHSHGAVPFNPYSNIYRPR